MYEDTEHRQTRDNVSFAREMFRMAHGFMVERIANTSHDNPEHAFLFETSESAWFGSWIQISKNIMVG